MADNWDSRRNRASRFFLSLAILLNLTTLITYGSLPEGFLLEAHLLLIGVEDYEHASR